MSFDLDAYVERAVREVLTAGSARIDAVIGQTALLLAVSGAAEEADRLVAHWHALTERPYQALATDPVSARAWAMLSAAPVVSGIGGPAWTSTLPPLDLDAEEAAHRRRLSHADPPRVEGPLGPLVSALAGSAGTPSSSARAALGEAEDRAAAGDAEGARAALARWAGSTGPHPDVAELGACRRLGPLLVSGADPLGLGARGASRCAGDLVAALNARHPDAAVPPSWRELVTKIMRLREDPAPPPPPAPLPRIEAAERRLGTRLPGVHRNFLLTCDGLPAHEVFPRLLGADELEPAAGGAVLVSERTPAGFVVLAPVTGGWRAVEWDTELGATAHRDTRALLVHHLRLLGVGLSGSSHG